LSNFDANSKNICNYLILFKFLTSSTISNRSEKEKIFSNVQKQYTIEAPGHPVETGQARRSRSTELTALSMSNGLPGHEVATDSEQRKYRFNCAPLPRLQGGA
jgi:hypothetical protein